MLLLSLSWTIFKFSLLTFLRRNKAEWEFYGALIELASSWKGGGLPTDLQILSTLPLRPHCPPRGMELSFPHIAFPSANMLPWSSSDTGLHWGFAETMLKLCKSFAEAVYRLHWVCAKGAHKLCGGCTDTAQRLSECYNEAALMPCRGCTEAV